MTQVTNSNNNFDTIFNRKPAKMGSSYIFTIPKQMIDEGVIDPEAFYEIRVKKFDTGK